MHSLWLTLLGIIVVFALVIVAGGKAVAGAASRALRTQHEQTEFITSTGLAPERWYRGHLRLIRLLRRLGLSEAALDRLRYWSKDRLERRLLGLIHYFERANVVPDEQSRRELTGLLRRIGKEWEATSWQEVLGLDDEEL